MKDYKLSEVRAICEEHYSSDGCHNCPLHSAVNIFMCRFGLPPTSWFFKIEPLDTEKDKDDDREDKKTA